MIISQDIDLIETIKLTLKARQCHFEVFYEVEEGLALARQMQVDVILLEMTISAQMVMKGLENLAGWQSEKLGRIPIVLINSSNIKHTDFGFALLDWHHYLSEKNTIDRLAIPNTLGDKLAGLLEL